MPTDEPCSPWLTPAELPGCGCSIAGFDNEAALVSGIAVSSAWLYRMSGRQFSGACSRVVRPVGRCFPLGPGIDGWALLDEATGQVVPAGWAENLSGRQREWAQEIPLGYFPIRSISEVRIDGQILDPAAYRVDDDGWLVRTDGGSWPILNDFTLDAASDPGTMRVSFLSGWDPPADGIIAAGVLGFEIAKSLCGDECKLPQRVQSMSRQGVTLQLIDPTSLLDNGRFGILVVDAFLESVNPSNVPEPAAIVNVDQMRQVRRAGTSIS